jgi:hypothetical protein
VDDLYHDLYTTTYSTVQSSIQLTTKIKFNPKQITHKLECIIENLVLNYLNIFFTLLSQKPAEKTKLMTSLNVFLVICIITQRNFFYMYRRTERVPILSLESEG